ncbi:MAG: hypothetical protein MUE51_03910 [Thermoleophilia bacterium]|jgi:hypothetical protein|nr:hypothetical protein [Thermoleophilia bacterium]
MDGSGDAAVVTGIRVRPAACCARGCADRVCADDRDGRWAEVEAALERAVAAASGRGAGEFRLEFDDHGPRPVCWLLVAGTTLLARRRCADLGLTLRPVLRAGEPPDGEAARFLARHGIDLAPGTAPRGASPALAEVLKA